MKILYVTTIGLTMCFFQEHIKMLLKEGHTVELACNTDAHDVPPYCQELGLKIHHISFSRSPFSGDNVRAYRQLKALVATENYDIVHTHTPNASAIVRLACRKLRKKGLKVFYTAHGFHFYEGAPLVNWLIYYPVEWLCSWWTDTLITINQEDYERAKQRMHAKRTEIIPGVGVDLARFAEPETNRTEVRDSLGIAQDAKVLIYIAELNKNKNQISLLDMLAELRKTHPEAVLLLVGAGAMREVLEAKAERLGLKEYVVFTGFRKDIADLLYASDVAVPSSIREGFGLNVIEAMACGVPVVAYDNRGHRTIIQDGENGYLVPHGDYVAMATRVILLLNDRRRMAEITKTAHEQMGMYSMACAVGEMKLLYESYNNGMVGEMNE